MDQLYSYKLTLSYKGTHYRGWQKHPDNPNTIQACIENVLSSICDYQDFKLVASGRTDAGVHAQAQVIRVDLPLKISCDHLKMGLNTKLPGDIFVTRCQECCSSFNPNDSVVKEYHYYFTDSEINNASLNEMIYYHPSKLDIENLVNCCKLYVGSHNFLAFTAKLKGSSIREILHCSIEKTSFAPLQNDIYFLKIQSKGFLTYMIRFIMGSLLQLNDNQILENEILKSLGDGSKLINRFKAPARGLHLIETIYP